MCSVLFFDNGESHSLRIRPGRKTGGFGRFAEFYSDLSDFVTCGSDSRKVDGAVMPFHSRRFSVHLFRLAVLVITSAQVTLCSARDHVDGFDGAKPSWTAMHDRPAVRVSRHERTLELRREGNAAELFDVSVQTEAALLHLVYQLPAARLIEGMNLSVWFNASQDGATVAARIVFPNQVDPDTNASLMLLVEGDSYSKVNQWQKLECNDIERKVRQMLPQIRRRLQKAGVSGDLDLTGRYVDTAVIKIRSSRGTSRFLVDTLKFGPIVEARKEGAIQPVDREEPEVKPEAEFRGDRLYVNGQPYFLRAIPYHGEKPADLARQGYNVVWIPDIEDTRLLNELDQAGLRAMAVPPKPEKGVGADAQEPTNVHLAPFGPDTSRILFWYLGTKIQPEDKTEIANWIEQISSADRKYRRQVMGDVAGFEKTYSLQFSMLGVHRPVVNTSFTPKNYRDWLAERRNLARPGTYLWTWIQTEPPKSVNDARAAAGWHPVVVEPEQLELQVMAALAAGYRGIAYWTNSSLDDDRPGARERKLMIALLNMRLELLEPLLATATVGGPARFTAKGPASRNLKGLSTPGRIQNKDRKSELELNDRDNQFLALEELTRDLEASTLNTSLGRLVLPVWYAEEGQFCPGRMAANDAKIIAEGGGESARAWEITLTGVRQLEALRVAGGRQVSLDKFDVSTAILFTTNQEAVEQIREKIKTLAEPAARFTLELAQTKNDRVAAIDEELRKLGRGQDSDSHYILRKVRNLISQSSKLLQAQRYHEARLAACDALQNLRILQYAHWSFAAHWPFVAQRLNSPVTSQHTICFQTLPDHWDMATRSSRTLSSPIKNLLRTGDCEDRDGMVEEGWKRTENEIAGIKSTGELDTGAHQGRYCLRLAAGPVAGGKDVPAVLAERPVTVTTPPVTVYKGQIVHISGWVKVVSPIVANLDGAILYDSIGGPGSALHWKNVTPWKQFELIREVTETTDLTLTISLTGLGDVRFDDLQIVPLDVEAEPARGGAPNGKQVSRPGTAVPWDFLKRLPGRSGKSE